MVPVFFFQINESETRHTEKWEQLFYNRIISYCATKRIMVCAGLLLEYSNFRLLNSETVADQRQIHRA